MINLAVITFLSFCFAVFAALHDAPVVMSWEESGQVTPKEMARFHRYNAWLKFIFCLSVSICGSAGIDHRLILMLFLGLLSFLTIYLVFDIALSVIRPGRSWDYLGVNDGDGRRWIKWFGKNAGKWKAAILLLLIVGIFLLYPVFIH